MKLKAHVVVLARREGRSAEARRISMVAMIVRRKRFFQPTNPASVESWHDSSNVLAAVGLIGIYQNIDFKSQRLPDLLHAHVVLFHCAADPQFQGAR